jgi:hypothetical protein
MELVRTQKKVRQRGGRGEHLLENGESEKEDALTIAIKRQ